MKRIPLRDILLLLIGLAFLVCMFGPAVDLDRKQDVEDAKRLPVEEFLVDRLARGAEHIYLDHYYLSVEAFQTVWQTVLYGHPELFYVSSNYQYTASDLIYSLMPEYTMDENERIAAKADYALALQDVLRNVDPNWSKLETALYLHDWVALHCVYDDGLEHYTAYELFMTGSGVCQSYAQAYQALLTECGIPCSFVLSEDMNHAWVEIQLENEWFNVDVTYDDPTFDRLGRVSHTYFLCSDAAFSTDHHGSAAAYPCTSTRYDDSMWSQVNTAFVPVDDTFYCISGNQICRWEADGYVPLHTISDLWYVENEPYTYWEGCFSALWRDGDGLLFNTPDTVARYDLTDGTVRTVYTYEGSGSIYGFSYIDGSLTCQISSGPNEPGTLLTAELS